MTLDQVITEQFRVVVREEIRLAFTEYRGGSDAPMSYEQAAAFAGCSKATISSWRRKGILPATGSGRLTRVLRADLLRVLEQLKTPPASTDETPEEFASRVLASKKPPTPRTK